MEVFLIKQKTLFGEEIEDWDFSHANTTYLTHGIHPYPARMIPQIANRLIKRYTDINDTLVDPFAGSGTVNLEAMLCKRNSYGVDINPLAHLIEKVKTSYIDNKIIDESIDFFKKSLVDKNKIEIKFEKVPYIPNMEIWFKDNVIKDLIFIKSLLKEFEKEVEKNYLNLIFSKTISDVANIDKNDNPYFIRSLKGDKLRIFNPNTKQIFLRNLHSISQRIRKLSKKISDEKLEKYLPKFYLKDSRESNIGAEEINALITSPPYGEEKNTMSYMRFAKLCLYWLDWTPLQLKELEKNSLGWTNGTRKMKTLQSNLLNELLSELETNSQKNRAYEVNMFFQDYNLLIEKAYNWLKKEGHFCIVIGNRSAKRLPVLNDNITVELAKKIGFAHVKTYYRNIPFKVLPKHDDKTQLINAESIIVLKK